MSDGNDFLLPSRKWDLRFLALARLVSSWSKDPSTKCGSVIVRDRHVIATGYNGFARGMRDDPEVYADREMKVTRIIHSEMNALLRAPADLTGCVIYNWPLCACDRCAVHVIQSGISRAVFVSCEPDVAARWNVDASVALFAEAGIPVTFYSRDDVVASLAD